MQRKVYAGIFLIIFLVLLVVLLTDAFGATRGLHENESSMEEFAESVQPKKDEKTGFSLPEIYITSDTKLEDIERYEYSSCTISITNTTAENCMEAVGGEIRGRGNSTWHEFDKKPYRIKLENRQNLFQMGADKDWALLSNPADYSLLRNEIALELGRIFELPYTSGCQWVQLFYNGDYEGLYLLCEVVETGINRVNIEQPFDAEAVDISFFLELGGELEGFAFESVEKATDNWGEYMSCQVVYPKQDIITQHQYEYIYAYMQMVNEAILSKDWEELTELVDIESFADWYLVNQLMQNWDMGWSMFAYKPQGDKLYLGPIWDFDQSCGVSAGSKSYQEWYLDTDSQNAWFHALMEIEEFQELISQRWQEKLPQVQTYLQEIKKKPVQYEADILANFERWPVIGTSPWRINEEIGSLATYQENADFLFQWLDNRVERMYNLLWNS